jgi:hypothetical protein
MRCLVIASAIYLTMAAGPALHAQLAGQADVIQQAKDAVTRKLKDPESARFRDLKAYPRGVCGQVNAKNSQGGYVGFRDFYFAFDVNRAFVPNPMGITDDLLDQFAKAGSEFCK